MLFSQFQKSPFLLFVLCLPILNFLLLFVVPFVQGSRGSFLSLSFLLHFPALSFTQLLESFLLLDLDLSEVLSLFVVQAIVLLLHL